MSAAVLDVADPLFVTDSVLVLAEFWLLLLAALEPVCSAELGADSVISFRLVLIPDGAVPERPPLTGGVLPASGADPDTGGDPATGGVLMDVVLPGVFTFAVVFLLLEFLITDFAAVLPAVLDKAA